MDEKIMSLDEEIIEKDITLITKTGYKQTLPVSIAVQSKLIESLVSADTTLTKMNIELIEKNKYLDIICQYMTYHNTNPHAVFDKPLRKPFKEYVSDYDYELVNINLHSLFKLIVVVDYLDIPHLFNLVAAKIASTDELKTIIKSV